MHDDNIYIQIAKEYKRYLILGASGTLEFMLSIAEIFNMDLKVMTLACMAWMYYARDHSLFEMMIIANRYFDEPIFKIELPLTSETFESMLIKDRQQIIDLMEDALGPASVVDVKSTIEITCELSILNALPVNKRKIQAGGGKRSEGGAAESGQQPVSMPPLPGATSYIAVGPKKPLDDQIIEKQEKLASINKQIETLTMSLNFNYYNDRVATEPPVVPESAQVDAPKIIPEDALKLIPKDELFIELGTIPSLRKEYKSPPHLDYTVDEQDKPELIYSQNNFIPDTYILPHPTPPKKYPTSLKLRTKEVLFATIPSDLKKLWKLPQ
jgi:hypothetical protein